MNLKSIFVFALFPVTFSGISEFLDRKGQNLIGSGVTSKLNVEYYISGYSNSFTETINFIKDLPPDFLLLDDSFIGQENVLSFLNDICKHKGKSSIIIYTASNNYRYLKKLIKFGVRSLLHKKMTREEFVEAMYVLAESGSYISEPLRYLLNKSEILSEGSFEEKMKELTIREKEVIVCWSEGHSRKEIAEKLYISAKTVDRHMENAKRKLDIKYIREIIKILNS